MNIARRARNLFIKHNTNNPFIIAETLGFIVIFMDLPPGVYGYCRKVLRRKIIVIDSKLSETLQTYICAHELAHILLHDGIDHYFIKNNTFVPMGKYERQANQFAVHFLTQGQFQEPDELQGWYLSRCGIPDDLHKFY
jgi:Zn-dependent peptidase ImmA (M78 family)